MAQALEGKEFFTDENSEDLSYEELDQFPEHLVQDGRAPFLLSLQLNHNQITVIPRMVGSFRNLMHLDISNNGVTYISNQIMHLQRLRTFSCRNNRMNNDALPKEIGAMSSLQVVNFSGNQLTTIPDSFVGLPELKCLYLGANYISSIPQDIDRLEKLEVLHLGGNRLETIPTEVGHLHELTSLNLCDNRLIELPKSLSRLRRLHSLMLHDNQLSTLPPEIVTLDLIELSLRNNPLIMRFVQDIVYEPPTLLELAGRVIKIKNVKFSPHELPRNLVHYLCSAQRCVNFKCKGVYFTSCVQQIKFVDFCGKYRLPLLQYLCSPNCTTTPIGACSDSESEDEPIASKLKKVLLG